MALTSNYTYRLDTATSTGTVLNDDSLSFPFVDIQKVVGLDSAPYRETIRDHEGTDGGFIDAEFEKGRDIILEGLVYCDPSNVESYMDTLKLNYAPVTTPVEFHFKGPGISERLLYVKPRGVRYDIEQLRRIGITAAQFLLYAEDPRVYDATLTTVVISYGGDAGNGFAFSFGFNLDFGGGASPAGQFVTNSGNRPAPATLTIQGPVQNPLIANDTNGGLISFSNTLSLTGSDSVVIDLKNRTAIQNGSTNVRSKMVTANWFMLDVGSNFIRYGGTSGTGSTLTVAYRNAWR